MFCPSCGNPINEQARFCASCGAPCGSPAVLVSGHPAAPRKSLKDRIVDSLPITIGCILLVMSVGYMSLSVIGRVTTAQVTEYEQVLIINNDDSTRNPSRYKLQYTFSVGGKKYTGSVTRVFSGGSHMRQTIPVRYLPFWPHVNAEDGKAAGIAGPVMAGIGVDVLVFVS